MSRCGIIRGFPPFFTGMAYGLSAPLYQWIASANLTHRKVRGLEDVRTGQFLLNLDGSRREEKLVRLNLDPQMGDWVLHHDKQSNTFRTRMFDSKTVIAMHGLKKAEHMEAVFEIMSRQ